MANHFSNRNCCTAIVLLSLALPIVSASAAIDTPRYDYQGAGGVCQPTAAQFERGLRSRPLGLANEGTTTAFVSCALQGNDVAAGRLITQVDVVVANGTRGTGTISCTLVAQTQAGMAFYSARTSTPAPGQAALFTWFPTDAAIDGGTKIGIPRPSLQCSLPPSAVLQYTALYYREDISN
ncbi:MAG: hypothetical protein ACREO8_06345 [Luteimonas sp.]